MIQFAMAGVLGFVVDASVLYLCLWAGSGYFAGRVVSFLCAVFATWRVNRRYAFADARERSAVAEFVHYLTAMALGGCVNYAVYSAVVLVAPVHALTPLLAVAAGSGVAMCLNFVSAKLWVFRAGRGR